MPGVSLNFTDVNAVPAGELLLKVEKADTKTSNSGHPMVTLQCAIIAAEDDRWVGRKIFPILLLETDMIRETFKALIAMGLNPPEGNFTFDTDDLLNKEVWVFAKSANRPDGQGLITQIKRWGITPVAAKAAIE